MKIAAIRKKLGLTQRALARLVGVHEMTVSRWERGLLRPTAHQRSILRALEAGPAGTRAKAPEIEALAGFLNQALIDVSEIGGMRLSASNQLRGTIVELELGPISTRVVMEVAPGVRLVSVITTASATRLGLRHGMAVVAIIKATEVILGVELGAKK